MSYLLGLDIGTSAVKCILISKDGSIIGSSSEEYPLSTPYPGWTEQDPDKWWKATEKTIKNLLNISKINPEEIKGISLSGQMHSSVFLDENLEIIRPAILWSDTRTSKQCDYIYAKVGGINNLINYVSNPALEGFTAPKILWLRENEPENYKKLRHVLLPKDYIRFKLTGELYTDVSDAAGTLMFNVEKKEWSKGLLEELDIDPNILPPVLESQDIAGEIIASVANETGLKEGTSVVAGGADQSCGAIGSGIVKEGRVMVSLGTSGVVLAQTNSPVADEQGRIHLFNYSKPNSWYMMGVMLSAGMSYQWLKKKMYADNLDFSKLNELAGSVAAGSEGLVFLPYLFGERTPHADADARGVFFGISDKHSQGHFIRSVMEGVTFGLRDSLTLIKEKGIEINEVRVIGGGAKSQVWQQILADIFGEEICLLNVEEGPAFGAAVIAGVGTGVYESFEHAEANIIKVVKRIKPDPERHELYNKIYNIYRNLYPTLKSNFKDLAQVNKDCL